MSCVRTLMYPLGFSFFICPAGWPVGRDWLLPGVTPIQVQAHLFNRHQPLGLLPSRPAAFPAGWGQVLQTLPLRLAKGARIPTHRPRPGVACPRLCLCAACWPPLCPFRRKPRRPRLPGCLVSAAGGDASTTAAFWQRSCPTTSFPCACHDRPGRLCRARATPAPRPPPSRSSSFPRTSC